MVFVCASVESNEIVAVFCCNVCHKHVFVYKKYFDKSVESQQKIKEKVIKAVFDEVEHWAKILGKKSVQVGCLVGYTPLMSFYKKMGYKTVLFSTIAKLIGIAIQFDGPVREVTLYKKVS